MVPVLDLEVPLFVSLLLIRIYGALYLYLHHCAVVATTVPRIVCPVSTQSASIAAPHLPRDNSLPLTQLLCQAGTTDATLPEMEKFSDIKDIFKSMDIYRHLMLSTKRIL
jgi:hypothetical protein